MTVSESEAVKELNTKLAWKLNNLLQDQYQNLFKLSELPSTTTAKVHSTNPGYEVAELLSVLYKKDGKVGLRRFYKVLQDLDENESLALIDASPAVILFRTVDPAPNNNNNATAPNNGPNSDKKIKILFLHADPKTLYRDSETEIKEVKENLKDAKNVEFIVAEKPLTTSNFQNYLFEHKPNVLHFCGHGTKTKKLVLCNEKGDQATVEPSAVGNLFSLFKHINIVVLSACFSENQAQEIAKHIPFVVGNPDTIGIDDACKFAAKFYLSLSYDQDVEKCVKHGVAQILLDNSKASIKDQWLPKLIKSEKSTDPAKQGSTVVINVPIEAVASADSPSNTNATTLQATDPAQSPAPVPNVAVSLADLRALDRNGIATKCLEKKTWKTIGECFEHKGFTISYALLKARYPDDDEERCQQMILDLAQRSITIEELAQVLEDPRIGLTEVAKYLRETTFPKKLV